MSHRGKDEISRNQTMHETHSNTDKLIMRHMSMKDFELVRSWCIEEGWNLGLYDASAYYQADPNGHLLFLEKNLPVGSISLVKHSDTFMTIGPYIVKKEYREKGYGAEIWKNAKVNLKSAPNPNILLYSVPAQVHRYSHLNFKSQFTNQRWQLENHLKNDQIKNDGITPITPNLIKQVSHYDKKIFSASRQIVFSEMLTHENIKGFVIQNDNHVMGFGFIRPCIKGYRIGPLMAEDINTAKSLITALVNSVNNRLIIIDSPAVNNERERLMKDLGFSRVEESDTIAMISGPLPCNFLDNIDRYYAIFSLEIG